MDLWLPGMQAKPPSPGPQSVSAQATTVRSFGLEMRGFALYAGNTDTYQELDLLGREELLSIREDHLLNGDDGRDEMFATLELLAPELIRDDLELKTRVVSHHRYRK